MSTIQNPEYKTAAFTTLGCKVNQYETQVMREALTRHGYRIVAPDEPADVYVINTCTVTGVSDRKSRQMIRRAAALNPDALVVVTGCYVERSPDEIRDMPDVDMVLFNREKHLIGEYLREFKREIPLNPPLEKGDFAERTLGKGDFAEQALEKGGFAERTLEKGNLSHQEGLSSPLYQRGVRGDLNGNFSDQIVSGGDFLWHPGITTFDGQTRALVKIEDGCDSFCTYCIIPYTRGGTIRSRPIDGIIPEVRSLAKNGHREVVLTGIHLGAYGRDMTDGTMLAHVLRAVHDVDGIERIRLSSIEPMDISDDLIDTMARLPKCALHFHVSLQSGSDKILGLMRRGYTSSDFEDVVNKIRAAMPDVGLSTDVMVGFPGETEQDFRDTYDLISRVKFNRLHVFRYSPRGTPAAKFPDQVQGSIASRRSEKARSLGDSLAQEFRSRMLGKLADVLVEDSREGKDKLLAGFTSNYVRVLIADASNKLTGRVIRVRLMNMENEYMIGQAEP